ncbi:MAG TPA: primosomal protein N' [Pseudobdellovibrionaceae bacterium]|nr:primosomal protein N' [Pseudobdellovibrionaceae bacterium]
MSTSNIPLLEEAPHYYEIYVQAPLNEPLTYMSSVALEKGTLVQVPLGRRKSLGIVSNVVKNKPNYVCKSILNIIENHSSLPPTYLDWLLWVSSYYSYPLGMLINSVIPPLKKNERSRASKKALVVPQIEIQTPYDLNQEQQGCFNEIRKSKDFKVHLIYGVTGSGKTEVYLALLEEVLKAGKSAVVLVPEISLTPQLIKRFSARFGDNIAALHSQLTERERTNQWWQMVDGKKGILIGARSAIFCPLKNLGMIVVDEEHEPSYKQEEKLRYHGRDAAIMMAKKFNCPIVLGSATPSLESWKNVLEQKYQLHVMKKRVENRSLPTIEIIDLRQERKLEKKNQLISRAAIPEWMSDRLFQAIVETLDQKKQVALFLNRRGLSQTVVCKACGHTKKCPNCDIHLTLHSQTHLICHYCDYHENFSHQCPECREKELEALGIGTELIENDLRRLFPEARLARADRDEIQNREQMEDLIFRMENSEIDILIGTQMIAKGLDFPNLNLVGLLLADVGFNVPDFRATERSFQIITQMSGRSGRHIKEGESPGIVIIQTLNPKHDSITYSQNNDYEGFSAKELEQRKDLNYPPYGRLINLKIIGAKQDHVHQASRILAQRGRSLLEKFNIYNDIEILGPVVAPISKLRGQYRYQVLLKGMQAKALHQFHLQLLGDLKWTPSGVRIQVDVDPYQMM